MFGETPGKERFRQCSIIGGLSIHALQTCLGQECLYYTTDLRARNDDIWVLPLTGERKPFPFAQTASNEQNGQFSPDSRWIAYQSDESQRFEIYVAPFSGSGGASAGKRQISTSGGIQPRW